MKFSLVSLLAFSTVALTSAKKRNLKGGKGGKGSRGGHESNISHHNADYQDHYLVSTFVSILILIFSFIPCHYSKQIPPAFCAPNRLDCSTTLTMVSSMRALVMLLLVVWL